VGSLFCLYPHVPPPPPAPNSAFPLPPDARRARHEIGAAIVRTNDVQKWMRRQLSDIELMRSSTPV
jgi:trehalose-6-phosphate synthase